MIFPREGPRRPRALPRYLPAETDRRLVAALEASSETLAANALLLARATGLRIGELVDLELDCVHEVPGQGAWLKVPLGKLKTERMVPLDDDVVGDRRPDRRRALARPAAAAPARRPPGRVPAHPPRPPPHRLHAARHARPRRRGRRASTPSRPHQLRHTYATALINAGVWLQALMALLGHSSAAMSLRYGRLFDATVRADYERALTLAKQRLGPVLPRRARPRSPTATGASCH